MTYRVIRPFQDLTDVEQHEYAVSDPFPRSGYTPPEGFTKSLLTGQNSAGSIFIEVEKGQDPVLGSNVSDGDKAEKPKRKRTKKAEE